MPPITALNEGSEYHIYKGPPSRPIWRNGQTCLVWQWNGWHNGGRLMLDTSDTTQINQLSYVSYDLYIVNKYLYMHNTYLFAWPDQPQYSPFIAAANESINKPLRKRFPCRNDRIEDGRNSYVCKLKSIMTYILRRLDNCTAYWSIFQLGVIGWHVDFYLWLNNNYLIMADYITGLEQNSIFTTDGTSIIYWPIQM